MDYDIPDSEEEVGNLELKPTTWLISPQHYFDAIDSFINAQKLDKPTDQIQKGVRGARKSLTWMYLWLYWQHLSTIDSNKRGEKYDKT